MINWQVLGQLLALFFLVTAGPAIILLIALKKDSAL
jgi:hypothetical protein|tara:strand:+ start:6367 stop:6474 length:108 start_codon:yes stop_codon:yes gene_type:complete